MADGSNGKQNGRPKWGRWDWPSIEARYVTGNMSLAALAKDIGCAETHIRRIFNRDDWKEKRAAYVRRMTEAAQENRQRQAILNKIEFDAVTENVSDNAMGLVGLALDKLLSNFGTFDAMEIRELLTVAQKAQELKYRALNVPPPKQSVAIERIESPADALLAELRSLAPEIAAFVPALQSKRENGGNGKRRIADA